MATIIITIIVSTLLGFGAPINSLGVNFPSKNLFSQIIPKLQEKKLSDINPVESLRNVTAPLDSIWKALGSKLNGLSTYSGPLKLSLEGRLNPDNTFTLGSVYGVAKSAVILVASISIAVLEIVLGLLKGLLGLLR